MIKKSTLDRLLEAHVNVISKLNQSLGFRGKITAVALGPKACRSMLADWNVCNQLLTFNVENMNPCRLFGYPIVEATREMALNDDEIRFIVRFDPAPNYFVKDGFVEKSNLSRIIMTPGVMGYTYKIC
jgi:hypothetical protein